MIWVKHGSSMVLAWFQHVGMLYKPWQKPLLRYVFSSDSKTPHLDPTAEEPGSGEEHAQAHEPGRWGNLHRHGDTGYPWLMTPAKNGGIAHGHDMPWWRHRASGWFAHSNGDFRIAMLCLPKDLWGNNWRFPNGWWVKLWQRWPVVPSICEQIKWSRRP